MIQVLYDAGFFANERYLKTGLYVYSANLLRSLASTGQVEPHMLADAENLSYLLQRHVPDEPDLFSVFRPQNIHPYVPLFGALPFPKETYPERHRWEQLLNLAWYSQMALAEQLLGPRRQARLKLKFDLIHYLAHTMNHMPGPKIATVHDLIPIFHAEWNNRRYSRFFKQTLLPFYIKECRHILCVSENSRNDLLAFSHLPPERVSVVYPGISSLYYPEPAASCSLLQRCGVGDNPYFICLASLVPHKNHVRSFAAFDELRQDARFRDYHLVLIGQQDKNLPQSYEKSLNTRLRGAVHFTGFLPQAEIRVLLSRATALIFPSLYEGFGAPPLEAMACGCPVVASRLGSLPEALGPSAEYVDAYDPTDIARGMARLALDSSLAAARKKEGLEWVKRYSYENTARETLAIYRDVLAAPERNRR